MCLLLLSFPWILLQAGFCLFCYDYSKGITCNHSLIKYANKILLVTQFSDTPSLSANFLYVSPLSELFDQSMKPRRWHGR